VEDLHPELLQPVEEALHPLPQALVALAAVATIITEVVEIVTILLSSQSQTMVITDIAITTMTLITVMTKSIQTGKTQVVAPLLAFSFAFFAVFSA
jgi:hypothetical protein